ncbi:hypothetical protein FNV43_RR26861 [Rhamnella rubrinervis]|uniref:Fe2OG dioxygenase domain-containing protein n=1 Tax=Rhamnella rubrinervis TaxID=2594499 RepID=A0A8K0DJC2_9ROSA|nr:hypothetical protein FNV43_RR26861 [Rhamnella rubrinervis]
MTAMAMSTYDADYDRANEVKLFDESKKGVKGLVDSGLTTIPRFFIYPPETLSDLKPDSHTRPESISIPIIDLSGSRSAIVDQISRAAREFGFFQIINHGIALETIERTISAIKAFHEQPTEIKAPFYRREVRNCVRYFSNIDLYHSEAASWRDTLHVMLGSNPPAAGGLPEICREEVLDWDREVEVLGGKLMGLMSEGLGLSTERLKEYTCLEGKAMVGQYYPNCPQPDLTMGNGSHTDPGVFTVLIQDQTGGLQVKYGGLWVDVKPVRGAIVVNVGDLLQIMTNDEYKSVFHRVLANSSGQPRVSVAVFPQPGKREELYGPLPELVSPNKPALYKQFMYLEYMRKFFSKQIDGKTLLSQYKL